jgi:hypothetical protein
MFVPEETLLLLLHSLVQVICLSLMRKCKKRLRPST